MVVLGEVMNSQEKTSFLGRVKDMEGEGGTWLEWGLEINICNHKVPISRGKGY